MANSIMKSSLPQSSWKYVFSIVSIIVIWWIITYIWAFFAKIWINNRIDIRNNELQQVEDMIKKIWSEKAFFSYKFAEQLTQKDKIKWSDQITALTEVLKQVQNNNIAWVNAIQLSNFSISPEKLTLQGKVTNLLLLYYSSIPNNYINLIDRFTNLPFITNVTIKKYNKIGQYYEFSLSADINPNAILKQTEEPIRTDVTTGSMNHEWFDTQSGSIDTEWTEQYWTWA